MTEMSKRVEVFAEPTPERLRQVDYQHEVGNARDRRDRTITVYPFATAYHRGQFTHEQWNTGQRFYHYWFRSGITGLLTSIDFNGAPVEGPGRTFLSRTDAEAHARQQYLAAEKLLGLRNTRVLVKVVCEQETPERAGRDILGWKDEKQARAAAVEVMRGCLDQLRELWRD